MANTPLDSNTVILITREGMGSAELPLQHKLITTYLKLLDANENLPTAICFYTDGVKLVVEGSPVVEELKILQARGVRLIAGLEGNAMPHLTQHDAVKRDVRTAPPGYASPQDGLRMSQSLCPASRVC